jgi:hypothetical protein
MGVRAAIVFAAESRNSSARALQDRPFAPS